METEGLDCSEMIGYTEAENLLKLEFVPFGVILASGSPGVVTHVGIDAGGQIAVYAAVDGVLPVALEIFVIGE